MLDINTLNEILTNPISKEEAFKKLLPREQKVLSSRFGLDDGKKKTLEEVAEMFSVTRERVRQIEVKAIRKICRPNNRSREERLAEYLD